MKTKNNLFFLFKFILDDVLKDLIPVTCPWVDLLILKKPLLRSYFRFVFELFKQAKN